MRQEFRVYRYRDYVETCERLGGSVDRRAASHFCSDWIHCEAILSLGLHPIRAVAVMEYDGDRESWKVVTHLNVECKEGEITDAEIDLSNRNQIQSLKDIWDSAAEIRGNRKSVNDGPAGEFVGFDGAGLREVQTFEKQSSFGRTV